MSDDETPEIQRCWLCLRPLGETIQAHHPVPKAKKGRETVPTHPICHKTIHANFTNAEMARIGNNRDRIMENPAMVKFVEWVSGKDPDFNARTR
jgi:hypothetical protein